ncbi:MAG TPA: hypothetical protein DD706_15530, partial [Nitrospiraceae bacterium]|nr:hypothetical protein [Nitrospiraceae bacterium]
KRRGHLSYCPPEIIQKFNALPGYDDNPRYLFHRLQLLSLIKRAILSDGKGQKHPFSISTKGDLWKLLAMANEHIQLTKPSTQDSMEKELAAICNFISATEFSRSHVRHRSKLARSTWLYKNFTKKYSLNIEQIFHKNTGLTITEYLGLCVGIMTYYFTDAATDRIKQDPLKLFLNAIEWFNTCSIDKTKIEKFLLDISSSIEEFRSAFVERNSGLTDFTPLKDRPLIRHNSKYWIIDLNFLIDKIDSGIFWKVHEYLPSNKRQQFHQYWGENFQDYVNWLLNLSCKNVLNKVLEAPKFVNSHDEVCDTIIVCGNSAVFIEAKGGLLTTEAKYGGDPNLLFEELKKKLIGDDAKRKGVTQLTHSINASFNKKNPRPIEGLDFSRISKIFPILLLKDDLGECLFVTHFLNRFFKQSIQRKKVTPKVITPLFCLGIETLEEISGYLEEVSLVSLLESWYKNDPALFGSFLAIENPVKQRVGARQNDLLVQEENRLWSSVTTNLFPGQSQ